MEGKNGKRKKQAENKAENKFEERQPIISRSISLSKDSRWLIIKTIRTDILHVNYMQKILGDRQ